MVNIYYSKPIILNQVIQLDLKASHHLRVLRIKKGEFFFLFNGDGYHYLAEVISIHQKGLEAKIIERKNSKTEQNVELTLVQGIARNAKMDLIIQKAVELGVNTIFPLYMERTQLHRNPKQDENRLIHWREIIISAAEQSGRANIPKLHAPIDFEKGISQIQSEIKYVCSPEGEKKLCNKSGVQSIALLIGPEGGLTDHEKIISKKHEFISLNLGPHILRTETASIAALSIIQFFY